MKKDQLAFLLGGLAFGLLFGFGAYHTWYASPQLGGSSPFANPVTQAPASMPPATGAPSPSAAQAPMVAQINELKRQLQQNPNDFATLVRLGNLYFDVQMWDQAAGFYERAVEVRPDDADVLTDLGTTYRGMGQPAKALDAFARASAADPRHFQSLFNTVIVAGFDLGQFERAEQALHKLESLSPPPPRLDELRRALEDARARAQVGGGSS
jgi:cytochrome c-type biogenesis protein CcmH/NrfG